MIELKKTSQDLSGTVTKLTFEDGDAIAETVVYSYEDKGIVCFATQCGCKIGCTFCNIGKFVRDLTYKEMVLQVQSGIDLLPPETPIQIMTTGEPMDNWRKTANTTFYFLKQFGKSHPFFISTVGLSNTEIFSQFLEFGKLPDFFLRFSLPAFDDKKRRALLGDCPRLLPLDELILFGKQWSQSTNKLCHWNYICQGTETEKDAEKVAQMLEGMHLTCSVPHSADGKKKGDSAVATKFADMVKTHGLDVSVLDLTCAWD